LTKEVKINFETGIKHQQKLAQIRHEVRYRSVFAENIENVGAEHDSGKQQPNHWRQLETAADWRHCQDGREHDYKSRKRGKRRRMSTEEVQRCRCRGHEIKDEHH
jgi:hypothetical protein